MVALTTAIIRDLTVTFAPDRSSSVDRNIVRRGDMM